MQTMSPDGNLNPFVFNDKPLIRCASLTESSRHKACLSTGLGKSKKRFLIDISCVPEEGQTTLHENFIYDDGMTEARSWTIVKQNDNAYTAHTNDVVGQGVGQVDGAVFKLKYDFLLTLYGRRVKVHFDDVMVRQTDTTILNRARVSKFGLLLGELFITFSRTG